MHLRLLGGDGAARSRILPPAYAESLSPSGGPEACVAVSPVAAGWPRGRLARCAALRGDEAAACERFSSRGVARRLPGASGAGSRDDCSEETRKDLRHMGTRPVGR